MLGIFVAFGALALVGLETWADRYAWPVDPAWYRIDEHAGAVTFGCQNFAPVQFTAAPQPGRIRIVVLGGSAAFGFPERPVGQEPVSSMAYGIAGVMQATLDAAWPGRFEVVNLGVNGGTSEDTLRLARKAMGWGPAALVVYDGNNEFMDVPRHITPALWRFALYRQTAVLRERATVAPGWVGAPAWTTTTAAEAVHARLRRDLDAVADLAQDASIPLVLSTQATNLAGFDPSWSTSGDPAFLSTLAAREDAELEQRLAETPACADLAWAVGQRRLAAGQDPTAALQTAVDHDGMAFRPTTEVNAIIRTVAADRDAVLVDAVAAVGGAPGEAEFYDWVHPRPGAARAIGGAIVAGLGQAGLLPAERTPSSSELSIETAVLPPSEAVARDTRVAVSWVQWACVRAHDPGFRLRRAEFWAREAAVRDPEAPIPAALLQVITLLDDPSAQLDPPLPEPMAARMAAIHPCVAARLGPAD